MIRAVSTASKVSGVDSWPVCSSHCLWGNQRRCAGKDNSIPHDRCSAAPSKETLSRFFPFSTSKNKQFIKYILGENIWDTHKRTKKGLCASSRTAVKPSLKSQALTSHHSSSQNCSEDETSFYVPRCTRLWTNIESKQQ